MGMSDDLEVAVAAGSTMVRVGRALFGERPPAPRLRWRLSGTSGRGRRQAQREPDRGAAWSPASDLPGLPSRHYAVPRQEKVCHPRS